MFQKARFWAGIGWIALWACPLVLHALTVPSIDGSAVGAASGNSSNVSLTVTGGSSSNRVLVVRIVLDTHTQNLVSGATWNGVALARFYSTMVPTYNTDGDYEVWYLVAPATGSNNLVVQWDGTSQTYNLSYAFYRDASQVAPLGAHASNPVQASVSAYTSTLYTQAAYSLVTDVLLAGAWNGTASIVQGAGQNVEYPRNVGGPIDIFGDNLATTANGAYNLTYALGANSDPYWSSQTLEIQAVPASQSVWRINCGGPAYTDSQSLLWSADTGYSDGATNSTTTAQTGTLDPTLYQSERYGSPSVDYSLTVPAGTYQVTLKFAEIFDCCAGQRLMNLSLNGSQVLAGLDVAGEVGMDYPDDKVYNNIAPVGGLIDIQAASASGSLDPNAKISAIQVIPQPAATPTWTPTSVVPVCAAWSLTGSAFASGAGVTLTGNVTGETGGAWNVAKVDLSQSFNWTFKAYFGSPGGADGIDFVLQNDPRGLTALALDGGGAKGYSGSGLITPSFAFDLEDFWNNGQLQPEEDGNPTALCGNAGMPCPYIFTSPIDNSVEHAYQVVWDASAKTLTLIVDGVARMVYTRDLVGAVFGGVSQVYWGFTAATGGASNLQYVYEVGCTAPTPTVTPTFSASPTVTPSVTPTGTPTVSPTMTPSPSPTGTPSASPTPTVTPTSTPVPCGYSVWVACGAAAPYTDRGGSVWAADQAYAPGGSGYSGTTGTFTTINGILGTADQTLYQAQRQGASFDYVFTLPDGNYLATFKFVESYFTTAGQRVFSVTNQSAGGATLISNLDVYQAAGFDKAYDVTVTVAVSGGVQDFHFASSLDQAMVSAIELQDLSAPACTPTATATPGSCGFEVAVDAGSAAPYTDGGGTVWTADQAYSNGSYGYTGSGPSYSAAQSISGTADPALYQTLHEGPGFTYGFNVPNGTYFVTLKFAELYFSTVGSRVFSVWDQMSGTPLATDLDLVAAAGQYVAHDVTETVSTTNGYVGFVFLASVNNAVLNAVSLVNISDLCSPTVTPTFSVSPSPTASPTPSVTLTGTPTSSPTPSMTPTDTPTSSPTPSVTSTATPTSSPTPSVTQTGTPTSSPTPSVTQTATPTASPTPSMTQTDTPTSSPSPSVTQTGTPTASPTPSMTQTDTPTSSPTPSMTQTGTPTSSPTPSVTQTATPTASPTPSMTQTATPTASPTLSVTQTDTPTSSPTLSVTQTATPTASPTLSVTQTDTPTSSPTLSVTQTDTPTTSPTLSVTRTDTPTASPSPSLTPTASPTYSPSASPSATLRPTPSDTPSPSATRTVTPTATPSLTPTVTPTAGTVAVTLWVYDSGGLLLRQIQEGSTGSPLTAVSLGASPYDPGQGPLLMGNAVWSGSFDGKDSSGAILRNGFYLLDLRSSQGGTVSDLKIPLQVLGSGGGGLTVEAAPNPASSTAGGLIIQWSPAQAADLSVHGLDGGLVRDFGRVTPPQRWDLGDAGGQGVAAGVYVVGVRLPGQRRPHLFKVAVLR